MAISDLVSEFISRFKTYTPVVHLLEDSSLGTPVNQKATSNAAHVYNTNGTEFVDPENRCAVIEEQLDYERCASGSDTTLGGTGAAGDRLVNIHVENGCTAVAIKDNGSTIYTWTVAAGETFKTFSWTSQNGAWSINPTGAAAVAGGRFAA